MKKKTIVAGSERNILDFRKSGWKDIMVLGKYNYKQAHDKLAPHSHRQMLEICFCSKGEQVYEVNDTLYRIRGGDLFVTYPGELHGTGKYPEEKGELYWIIIRVPPTKKTSSFLQFENKLAAEWYKQLLRLPRHFKGNAIIKMKLENIFRVHAQSKNLFRHIQLQHSIGDFLLEVIKASQTPALQRQTGRMEKIDVFIKDHLDEPVVLQELAELAGLSLSRFKAWFKEETGTTPLDYVLKYKIKNACLLLEKQNRTIADVAFETG
ncbi:MAG: AraC family transcriptional regulator, partial [Chitinophagaceae bacterium]